MLALTVLFMRRRGNESLVDEEDLQEIAQPAGPPVSTLSSTKEIPEIEGGSSHAAPLSAEHGAVNGPPIPEGGIPAGWTEEQWQYYGQQYLDGTCESRHGHLPACVVCPLGGGRSMRCWHLVPAAFYHAFKQPAPLPSSERLRCSRSLHGRGLNFEVVTWKGWREGRPPTASQYPCRTPVGRVGDVPKTRLWREGRKSYSDSETIRSD